MSNDTEQFDAKNAFSLRDIFPDAQSVFTCKPPPPLSKVKDQCIVVLDTNVLVVPYTVSPKSLVEIRNAYTGLLEQKRLVIPAHVAREFAKIRARKIGDIYEVLHKKVSNPPQLYKAYPLLEAVPEFAEVQRIEQEIERKLPDYKNALQKLMDRIKAWNWDDPVSSLYLEIFRGAPIRDLPANDAELQKEFSSRNERNQPPGYKDAGKDTNSAGDFVIWKTILDIGRSEKKPLLFVSNEGKPDWWHKSGGQPLYVRYELVDEYRRSSEGQGFYLSSLADFLSAFGASETAVDEVRVEEMVAVELSGGRQSTSWLEQLKSAANRDPLAAFVEAMCYLDGVTARFAEQVGSNAFRNMARTTLFTHRWYAQFDLIIPEPLRSRLREIIVRERNFKRSEFVPDPDDVRHIIDVIIEFEQFLNGLDIDEIKRHVAQWRIESDKRMGGPPRF